MDAQLSEQVLAQARREVLPTWIGSNIEKAASDCGNHVPRSSTGDHRWFERNRTQFGIYWSEIYRIDHGHVFRQEPEGIRSTKRLSVSGMASAARLDQFKNEQAFLGDRDVE
jgi:hypothetical protein